MFSVALLALQDDQIDLVRDTVLHWCAAHGHDANSQNGRSAMQLAISLALGGARDPAVFATYLETNIAADQLPGSE